MKHKWTLDELIDQWTLLPTELELVKRSKTAHNQLGAALLLKYFQVDSRFPRRQRDVPQAAIEYIAKQLNISADQYTQYDWRGRMIKMHRAAIRAFLDFREGTTADAETVAEWLTAHILPHEAKQDSLIAAVYQRYRALKIEPPTSGRIERLVRPAQRRYSEQFCEQIATRLSAETKRQLDALLTLEVNEDGAVAFRSAFGHLKTDAGTISLKGILAEIEQLQRIRQVALPTGLFEDVPPHLVKVYRERVMAEKPREVRRHSEAVRYTLLAAFCGLRCREIIDNLVDLFIGIVRRIMSNAENTVDRRVLQEVKQVRGKGRLLFHIAKACVTHPDGIVSEFASSLTPHLCSRQSLWPI
jgi:hypothetical protein